jgi:CheY-like chemotaxis protein
MQKSLLTPSAISWSSRTRAARRFRAAAPAAGDGIAAGTLSDPSPGRSPRVTGRTELTIYIVEDSPAVKERLIEAIQDIPHARVVGSADAVAGALEGVRTVQPRVLILDIQLRGGSGFKLLKLMRAEGMLRPEIIIVVTNYPSEDYRTASRECGADHFFDKASEFHKVREVLLEMR